MKRVQVTSGQVAEMTDWLRRLTPDEYQERRTLLCRVTDPKCPVGPELLYPFKDKRPLEWRWRVTREGGKRTERIDIARLEAVPFHKDGEQWISGDEMLRRARDEKNFSGCGEWSQHDGEEILARANELLEEVRKYALILPDTEFLGEVGGRLVAYLVWRGGRWRLDWYFLGGSFDRDYRFLRLRK